MKIDGRQYKLIQESEAAQLWEARFSGGAPFFEVRRRRLSAASSLRIPGAVNWTYNGLNMALQKFDSLLPGSAAKVAEIKKGSGKNRALNQLQ